MDELQGAENGIIDLTPKNQETNLSPIKNGIADLTEAAQVADLKKRAQKELFDVKPQDTAKQDASAQAQEELKHDLEKQALTDSLTAIPNRRGLDLAIDQMLNKTSRSENPKGAFIIIDLDDFKARNDALGHSGGDKILRDFALKVGALIRPGDVVGRLGGDEFVIWAEDADLENSVVVADRVQQGIAEFFKDGPNNQTFSIGIKALSEGISSSDLQNPEFRKTLREKLYEQADDAHYRGAKNVGKNKIGVALDSGEVKTARVGEDGKVNFTDPVHT